MGALKAKDRLHMIHVSKAFTGSSVKKRFAESRRFSEGHIFSGHCSSPGER